MTLLDALSTVANGTVPAYAWPGGYPIIYITSDAAVLCTECVNKEIATIVVSTLDDSSDGWNVAGADINYEDADCVCDHCGRKIDPAYEA